jgi:hypothetical protein
LVCFDYTWIFFYVLFLAEPSKLSIFSHDICFDFRLNLKQNKKNWFFFWKKEKNIYPLVDRLIRLILTLPVSTATTERVFSVMNIVRTSIRNRIENDFLASYLNKTKSCWFFLQVMYNKLKQILYLVILFLTTSNKIILAPPRVAAMQWPIPIPIRKLHVLLFLAQFKYHFTILLSTLKEKVCFDLDFISYCIWWWICENLVTTEHVHCYIIHKPVQKDSVFIAFGCMHPLLLYNWCFFF